MSSKPIDLALALDGFDWNLKAGDGEFRRAIEINPGFALAHNQLGHAYLEST
jgi:hypothetical protein